MDTKLSSPPRKKAPTRILAWKRNPRTTPRVNLLRKVRLAAGEWSMVPVATKESGAFDFSRVMIGAEAVVAEAGTFYLDFRDNGKRRRMAIGETAKEAQEALATQRAVLGLRSQGMDVADAPAVQRGKPGTGITLADAIAKRKLAMPPKLRDKSVDKYKEAYDSFRGWAQRQGITHCEQIDRQTLLTFISWLVRDQELSPRTAVNKSVPVLTFLRDIGFEIKMRKGDWPRVTEEQPESYELADLDRLFANMKVDQRDVYQTFLQSGFRKQEVEFLAWTDFDAKRGMLAVTKKPGLKFDVKNYVERTIPIPPALVQRLELRRLRYPSSVLIFETGDSNVAKGMRGGKSDTKMLEKLKAIAWREGLNCGRCESVWKGVAAGCGERPICRKWTLHKFRHTYATTLLHENLDIVSLQHLLGHRDIASTLKYVRALKSSRLAEVVGASALARVGLG